MTGILIFIGMIGAAIGLGALGWYFSEEQAIHRAIAALPRIAIRDAKHGDLVRIQGKIRPHATPLNAPLSQKVCVH